MARSILDLSLYNDFIFDLKDWIDERLSMIWKLDAALNLDQSEGESALEEGHRTYPSSLRSGCAEKTETRPEFPTETTHPKNAIEDSKAA